MFSQPSSVDCIHLIEDVADRIHDPARVPDGSDTSAPGRRLFDLELEVVAHAGRVTLPLVRMFEVLGEPAPVASGQRNGGLAPLRAVVVPEMSNPRAPIEVRNLREVGDDIVDELVREPERIVGSTWLSSSGFATCRRR